MKPKICIITGTRADYGLLRLVMKGIKKSHKLELQVILRLRKVQLVIVT